MGDPQNHTTVGFKTKWSNDLDDLRVPPLQETSRQNPFEPGVPNFQTSKASSKAEKSFVVKYPNLEPIVFKIQYSAGFLPKNNEK